MIKTKSILFFCLTFISISQCDSKINKYKIPETIKKICYGTGAVITTLMTLDAIKTIDNRYKNTNNITKLFSKDDYDITAAQYIKLIGSGAYITIAAYITYLLAKKALPNNNDIENT